MRFGDQHTTPRQAFPFPIIRHQPPNNNVFVSSMPFQFVRCHSMCALRGSLSNDSRSDPTHSAQSAARVIWGLTQLRVKHSHFPSSTQQQLIASSMQFQFVGCHSLRNSIPPMLSESVRCAIKEVSYALFFVIHHLEENRGEKL